MGIVYRSPIGENDLRSIWRYIAADNHDAADRLLTRIDEKLGLYANHPRMGTNRDRLVPGLRMLPSGSLSRILQDRAGGDRIGPRGSWSKGLEGDP